MLKFTPIKKTMTHIFRWLKRIIVSLLILVVILLFLIFTPFFQDILTKQTAQFLSKKLDATVQIEEIRFSPTGNISIIALNVQDPENEPFLHLGHFSTHLDYWALLSNHIGIGTIHLSDVQGAIELDEHGNSNLDFITDAFASEPNTENQTEKNDWTFGIEGIELSQIHFNYISPEVKSVNQIGSLAITLNTLDFNPLDFDIHSITMTESTASLHLPEAPDTKEEKEAVTTPEILLHALTFEEVNFNLIQGENNQQFEIGLLELLNAEINENGSFISNDKLALHRSTVTIKTKPQEKEANKDSLHIAFPDLTVIANELDLSENKLEINTIDSSGDLNQLLLESIGLKTQFAYVDKELQLDIHHVHLTSNHNIELQEFNSKLRLNEQELEVEHLVVNTAKSTTRQSLHMVYSDINDLFHNADNITVHHLQNESQINLTELQTLLPQVDLSDYIYPKGNPKDVFIKGDFSGKLANFTIEDLQLRTGETFLTLEGDFKHILDEKQRDGRYKFKQIRSTKRDLHLLVGHYLPPEINIPHRVNLTAEGKITDKKIFSKLHLNSSSGAVRLTGTVDNYTAKNTRNIHYDVDARVFDFRLGNFIHQPDSVLGYFTLTASAKGSGLKKEEAKIHMDLALEKGQFRQYDYTNLLMSGYLENNQFNGNASIKDEHVHFNFDGIVLLDDEYPEFRFDLDLKNIDFHELHLTEDTLSLRLIAQSDFSGKGLNRFNGFLKLDSTRVSDNTDTYELKTFNLTGKNDSVSSEIKINSDFIRLDYAGNFPIGEMNTVLRNHFRNYFSADDQDSTEVTRTFNFFVQADSHPLINEILLPDLHRFDSLYVTGDFDSDSKLLTIDGVLPNAGYKKFEVDSLVLAINSNPENIDYNFTFNKFTFDQYSILNPTLYGDAYRDSLSIHFQVPDEVDPEKKSYAIHHLLRHENDTLFFTLGSDEFVLNGEQLQVNPENQIQISTNTFEVTNFDIHRGNESLKIKTSTKTADSLNLIKVQFDEFRISSFTNLIATHQEEDLFNAGVSGYVWVYTDLADRHRFILDMLLKDFHVLGNPLASINMFANMDQFDQVDYRISLSDYEHDFKGEGRITMSDEQLLLAHTSEIASLNLAVFAPFIKEQMNYLNGTLSGDFHIEADLKEEHLKSADLSGKLKLTDTRFALPDLNVPYILRDEQITFTRDQITINKLTLRDSLNNRASLDGTVGITNLNNPNLNLKVDMDNFLIFSKPASDTVLFYGQLYARSNINIRGKVSNPRVDAKSHILDKSNAVFILPDQDPALVEKDGLVTFHSVHEKDDEVEISMTDSSYSDIRGLDLIAELNIDKRAKIKVLINPRGTEYFEASGDGRLNFSINPAGKISMTGRYEIENGFYQMTYYDFVSRRFEIEKGSSINWTGEPLLAEMNIRAYNVVSTSPYNLIRAEVGQLTPESRVMYSRSIPFHVYLIMEGELMRPDLSFNIQLPEDRINYAGGVVNAKLQQINMNEGDVNKQAFALLALGRFIPESSGFDDPHSTGVGTAARNSLGQMFTQQLNQLSGKYLKAVDLKFDLESHEEYGSGGVEQQTNLDVQLSRAMFDERLIINLESSVNVEGGQQNRQNEFFGDVSLEYKLTEDGVYRMRAFRKGVNEQILGGLIIETGVGFVYNNDFNRYRDMFKRNKDSEPETE